MKEISYNEFYNDVQFEVRYCYLEKDAARFHFEVHHNNTDLPYLLAGYIDFTGSMKVEFNSSPIYMDKVVIYRIGLVLDYVRNDWLTNHKEIYHDHYSDST